MNVLVSIVKINVIMQTFKCLLIFFAQRKYRSYLIFLFSRKISAVDFSNREQHSLLVFLFFL